MCRGISQTIVTLVLLLASAHFTATLGQDLAPLPQPLEGPAEPADEAPLEPIPYPGPVHEPLPMTDEWDGPDIARPAESPDIAEPVEVPDIAEPAQPEIIPSEALPVPRGTSPQQPSDDPRRNPATMQVFDQRYFPGQHPPWSWKHFWHSRPDMVQRYAYFPESNGYYYMHPYNVAHIKRHQEFVKSWGGDVQNPYSNEIFEQLDKPAAAPTMPTIVVPRLGANRPLQLHPATGWQEGRRFR